MFVLRENFICLFKFSSKDEIFLKLYLFNITGKCGICRTVCPTFFPLLADYFNALTRTGAVVIVQYHGHPKRSGDCEII